MSSRDSASGSSTFHGGGKHINNSGPVGAGTGGGLAELIASLVSGAPQTNGLIAPPMPRMRPPQQTAPGKGSIPGAGNPAAPVPQVPAPGKGSLPPQAPWAPSPADLAYVQSINSLTPQALSPRLAKREGFNLAAPSGYADDPYYAPTAGMGPLPYDPGQNDVYLDPTLGGMRYRRPGSNFGGPK